LPLLFGVALGLGAIALAWTRVPHGGARPLAAASGALALDQGPSGGPVPANAVSGAGGAPAPATASDVEALRARALLLPVAGFDRRGLRDEFADARTGHPHEALDLLAPRGTPVLAADDGFVAKLFTSARGGLTVYQFDPTQTYCYYYAHLDAYAPGLHEGATLGKGSLLGFVGTTGNSPPGTPHLHFAIFRLGPEKRWWQGTALDPFPVWAGRG
jgi:murein DD-endopeptidase MepM/ murein hydrolase activator NlpD